jgi:hypothetical protein
MAKVEVIAAQAFAGRPVGAIDVARTRKLQLGVIIVRAFVYEPSVKRGTRLAATSPRGSHCTFKKAGVIKVTQQALTSGGHAAVFFLSGNEWQ